LNESNEFSIGIVGVFGFWYRASLRVRLRRIQQYSFFGCGSAALRNRRNLWIKKPIDAQKHLLYDRGNTGKEVILKFMSSYHSEVAAA